MMPAVRNPRLIGRNALVSPSLARTAYTPAIEATTPTARAARGKTNPSAGFAPIADGEAKARHPTTVIFAAKGFEAEAKKAAAVLPDAKVDKLTWKPGYELVVVIGGR